MVAADPTTPTTPPADVGPPLDPDPLAFSSPARLHRDNVAVQYDDGVTVVWNVERHNGGTLDVKYWSPTRVDPGVLRGLPDEIDVGDLALLVRTERPVRAFALPPGHIKVEHHAGYYLARSVGFLAAATLAIVAFLLIPGPTWNVFATVVLAAGAIASLAVRPKQLRAIQYWFITGRGRYNFAHLLDDRPQGRKAEKAVARVKEAYGALVSDVVYRIDHPALFDPSVPATRDFTAALIEWDNGAHLSGPERSTLAARVGLLFEAARSHAETVGIDHLPADAREPASRAAKALRLANDPATSAAEKAAAISRANAILESLMLYYLPRAAEVTALVEGKAPLALPGRRVVGEEAP